MRLRTWALPTRRLTVLSLDHPREVMRMSGVPLQIQWLEERIAARDAQEPTVSGESEILRSLRRFLEATGREKRRKQRVGPKK